MNELMKMMLITVAAAAPIRVRMAKCLAFFRDSADRGQLAAAVPGRVSGSCALLGAGTPAGSVRACSSGGPVPLPGEPGSSMTVPDVL
jgi:hypothetical protein